MSAKPILKSQRFEVGRKLGEGGMGVVYDAFDRERGTRVALKTLRLRSPEALLRFKNEFRLLQDLHHTNLVTLGELFVEDELSFFTMELVDGVSFLRWVRRGVDADAHGDTESGDRSAPVEALTVAAKPGSPAAGIDEGRLRAALVQLGRGLFCLHSAKRVHRDIKPSNVLVSNDGRLVILDFGLVTYSDHRQSERTRVGTDYYMAPEQAASRMVGPEADWYSVGVMLYQALTGVLPFIGRPERVLELKQTSEPIAPQSLVPRLPSDLAELCCDLLRRDPRVRPNERDILSRLGIGDAAAAVSRRDDHFVGRTGEMALLQQAFGEVRDGSAVSVVVHGESGIGKSALVGHFAEAMVAQSSRTVVLAGHCCERESVPYQALDGVIDDLSRYIAALEPEEAAELLPPDMPLLAASFPVLRRIPTLTTAETAQESDPQEIRRRLFGGVRELLRRLSTQRTIIMIVEDLQWADNDGFLLLHEILQPPDAPRLLFIGTARTQLDIADGDAVAELIGSLPVRAIPLPLKGLARADAVELARRLLVDGTEQSRDAAVIADEAAGHPLFINELARSEGVRTGASHPPLNETLRTRMMRLPQASRDLLELVAVAGAAVSQDVAARALATGLGTLSGLLSQLRAAKLLRSSGPRLWDAIEPYHDRVREAVLSDLPTERRQTVHRRLASALELSDDLDAEALAVHWRESGDVERAARYAIIAAEKAESALAFNRAARGFRIAIELCRADGEARSLKLRLAQALANAGRGAEAAQAFLDAAGEASDEAMLELQRRAADQFLRAGLIDEGNLVLQQLLRSVGLKMAKTPRRALWSLLRHRLKVRVGGYAFVERAAKETPPRELLRIDTCLSAATGLGIVDTIRGADFQAQHLLLSLAAGEPSRVALALGMETSFLAAGGTATKRRTARALALAERLAQRIDDPYVAGRILVNGGIAAFLEGRWSAAVDLCDRAELTFRKRCTGVAWERDTTQLFALNALAYGGDVRALAQRVPASLREAEQRGDLFAATNLSTGHVALVALAADQPSLAREQSAAALSKWSRQGWHLEHYYDLLAQCEADLYMRNATRAGERIRRGWEPMKDSLLMRVQLIRINMLWLRARCALALATKERSGALISSAKRDARAIASECAPWATPLADLLLAAVAHLSGRTQDARSRLQKAEDGFDLAAMRLHTAATRWRRGELLGGNGGSELQASAGNWMAAQQIKNPDGIARMIAPGF